MNEALGILCIVFVVLWAVNRYSRTTDNIAAIRKLLERKEEDA